VEIAAPTSPQAGIRRRFPRRPTTRAHSAFATAKRAPEGDAEVRARLHRIASEHKSWDRLADLYEGLAEQAETAHAAADLLMEGA